MHNVVIFLKSVFNESHNKDNIIKGYTISGGINFIKTSASNECINCQYWYDKGFKFQSSVFNHLIFVMIC